jgi:P27 family predicted phage terminase small subunit
MPAIPFGPPMKLTKFARREWDRILGTAHWLRESESVALADRCLCFQRLQECERILQKEGLTVKDSRGETTHPVLRIARAYRSAMLRYDAELGLTPSSRAGLHLPDAVPAGMNALERALCSGRPIDPIEADLCGEGDDNFTTEFQRGRKQ